MLIRAERTLEKDFLSSRIYSSLKANLVVAITMQLHGAVGTS